MRNHTREEFVDAVNELINTIVGKHGDEIEAIYAGGSFVRGDFVPGRSDVDLYVVAKKSDGKGLQKIFAQEARELEKKCFADLKQIHDEVLSIEVTTLDEIKTGKSFLGAGFEYHSFIASGKLLWGNSIKDIIPKPSRKAESASAQNYLMKAFGLVSQWEEQIRSLTEENKERLIRQAFSLIFRGAAIVLCGNGVYVGDKEEIVHAFKRTFTDEKELNKILCHSLRLWNNWKTRSLSNKETKQLLDESLRFANNLKALF